MMAPARLGMAAEQPGPHTRPAAPSFQTPVGTVGVLVARRGRPRTEDEEALFIIGGLVEEHDHSIRGAARLVGDYRGYPEHEINTFVEWALKEYARRRDLGTLPPVLPLRREREQGIRDVFQLEERLAVEAKEFLAGAEARARDLGLELSEVSDQLLQESYGRLLRIEDEVRENPRRFALRMQREGMTEDEAVAKAKELGAEHMLLRARLHFMREYLDALAVMGRNEGGDFLPTPG